MRNDDCILKELAKLTIAEIEEVKKRYKAMYPDDRRYCTLCEIARNKKLSDIRKMISCVFWQNLKTPRTVLAHHHRASNQKDKSKKSGSVVF